MNNKSKNNKVVSQIESGDRVIRIHGRASTLTRIEEQEDEGSDATQTHRHMLKANTFQEGRRSKHFDLHL